MDRTERTSSGTRLASTLATVPVVILVGAAAARWWPAAAAPVKAARPAAASARPALDARAQRVMAALTRVIREKVSSPGGKLQFTIQPTARAGDGYFSEVYISGRPAKIKHMRLSELALRARNVRVDVPQLLHQNKLSTLASTTTLRAVVTESDLDTLLAQGKESASMGLRVKYLGDRIRVAGNWKWSWFSGPVVGVGRLRLAPGSKVNIDILSLKLNGAEVPQFVKDKFSEKINPVIDYRDVPFQPRFKGLKMEGPRATLFA